jgi:cytochrome o ubiquinol oxidase subunit 2
METRLHLIANEAGSYDGVSANYSGGGFSGMKFKAIAMSNFDFDAWVAQVRASDRQLAAADYKVLAKPSEAEPVALYGKVEDGLYTGILHQYMGADGRAMAREGFDGGPVCTSRNTLGEERVSMTTPAKPALGAQS